LPPCWPGPAPGPLWEGWRGPFAGRFTPGFVLPNPQPRGHPSSAQLRRTRDRTGPGGTAPGQLAMWPGGPHGQAKPGGASTRQWAWRRFLMGPWLLIRAGPLGCLFLLGVLWANFGRALTLLAGFSHQPAPKEKKPVHGISFPKGPVSMGWREYPQHIGDKPRGWAGLRCSLGCPSGRTAWAPGPCAFRKREEI